MEPQQRDDIATLLLMARRLYNENNKDGALDAYRLALGRMPKDDSRRAAVERIIRAWTPPEPVSEPPPQVEQTRASRIKPGWIVLGCAVLVALALPVLLAFAYAQPLVQVAGPALSAVVPSAVTPTPDFPQARLITPAPAPTAAPTKTAASTAPVRSEVAFQDTFARLDPFKWVVRNSDGTTVDDSEGVLHLASSTADFPYVYTPVNPIPTTGNFRVTLRYRYPQVGVCGAPIVLASYRLPEGLSHDETNRISQAAESSGGLSLWFWYNVIYYRAGTTHQDIPVSNAPSAWHVATIDYHGGVYTISIDGGPVYTSPTTTVRPQLVWLGNPFVMDANCQWDSLDVSTVLVETMP